MSKHGRWKLDDEDMGTWRCSGCELLWYFSEDGPYENQANFCPKCGRRMIDKGKTLDDSLKAMS